MGAEFLSSNSNLLEQSKIQSSEQSTLEEQFLQFHLLPDMSALLPIHQLKEVLTIPLGQIVPIPHLPPYIMGIHNWRGEILWMLDLGYLLGLSPLYQQTSSRTHYTAVVIQKTHTAGNQRPGRQTADNKILGLVIHYLGDIKRLNSDEIRPLPSSAATSASHPYLKGHWLSSQGEIQAVLDGNSIFANLS